MADAATRPPVAAFHNSFPFRASNAMKWPSSLPKNTRSPAVANTPARALMDPEIANDPAVYPPPEVMAKLVDPKSLPDDQQRARVRGWTTIKTGQ